MHKLVLTMIIAVALMALFVGCVQEKELPQRKITENSTSVPQREISTTFTETIESQSLDVTHPTEQTVPYTTNPSAATDTTHTIPPETTSPLYSEIESGVKSPWDVEVETATESPWDAGEF